MIYPLDSLKAFNADMLWDERFVVIDGRFYVYAWYVCKFPDEENPEIIMLERTNFEIKDGYCPFSEADGFGCNYPKSLWITTEDLWLGCPTNENAGDCCPLRKPYEE